MVVTEHPSILLVDDDPNIRDALVENLTDEGYCVHAVGNGQEALDWLEGQVDPPGVVLLDLMMPVMDGHAFLAAREASPLLAGVPVVVISASCDWDGIDRNRVRACLPKPIALDRLLSAIDACA